MIFLKTHLSRARGYYELIVRERMRAISIRAHGGAENASGSCEWMRAVVMRRDRGWKC